MSDTYLPIPSTQLNLPGTRLHYARAEDKLKLFIQLNPNPSEEQQRAAKEFEAQAIFAELGARSYLSSAELASLNTPNPEIVDQFRAYLEGTGMEFRGSLDFPARLVFRGTIAEINQAFQTSIGVYQGPNRQAYLAYEGTLCLPAELAPLVQSISGIVAPLKTESRVPSNPAATTGEATGYTVHQLMEAYHFPTNLTGAGQEIGIVELGGTYKQSDLDQYFASIGQPTPEIITFGTPVTTDSQLDNSEVTLDIQVAGAAAPGARIIIYYGSTIAEALQLMLAHIHDHRPAVISISWAASEYNYTGMQIRELDGLFYQASLLGITVVAASGDHGGMNGKNFANVSIPSSHPLVLGVGGTAPILGEHSHIDYDTVWCEQGGTIGSGGGFSALFTLPDYQRAAVLQYPYVGNYYSHRGVPDVAASASSERGYLVVFNGEQISIGGTSASTPLIAGLIALLCEGLNRRLGFINAFFYRIVKDEAFQDVFQGSNGVYPAVREVPWNPGTGLGSPKGERILELLRELSTAG